GVLDLAPADVHRQLCEAGRRLSGRPDETACLHRDLHDKQVLVDAHTCGVGMLDFDLLAAGEPALDLANLLVHLELRAMQGWCSPYRAQVCAAAVLDGYRPGPGVRRRLPGYDLTTRLRLVAVYGFRPPHRQAAARLLSARAHADHDVLKEKSA
ncbi:MAG: phosphotransferase, partial [Actinomycetota bacterium]|nr:phosphotransferase [Actinomycetota bacterium]